MIGAQVGSLAWVIMGAANGRSMECHILDGCRGKQSGFRLVRRCVLYIVDSSVAVQYYLAGLYSRSKS